MAWSRERCGWTNSACWISTTMADGPPQETWIWNSPTLVWWTSRAVISAMASEVWRTVWCSVLPIPRRSTQSLLLWSWVSSSLTRLRWASHSITPWQRKRNVRAIIPLTRICVWAMPSKWLPINTSATVSSRLPWRRPRIVISHSRTYVGDWRQSVTPCPTILLTSRSAIVISIVTPLARLLSMNVRTHGVAPWTIAIRLCISHGSLSRN